jgi:hypothetical protein
MQTRNYCISTPDKIIFLIFAVFATIYAWYVHIQNANVFFEAQFLHAEFLKELLSRHITPRGFFTVFGEHMFPGYNLILAVNVALFRLWGGFDSVVHGIFIIISAALIVERVYSYAPWSPAYKVSAAGIIAFLLLSTTNNPFWGMALAAAGGVCLFILCVRFVEDALWGSYRLNPFFFAALPAAQILFLGGYGIGSIAALGALLAIYTFQHRKISVQVAAIAITIIITLAMYLILITHYSSLMSSKPTALGVNIGVIAKFAVLMTGSSILGRTFFEQTSLFWPYYVVGVLLIVTTLAFWAHIFRHPGKGAMFMFALSVYSIVNIVAVAFFRYRNGLDGALGQWYNVHTHFIAVCVIYYLFSIMANRTALKMGLSSIILVILVSAAIAGYTYDWRKAPAVPAWKERFISEAPIILAFPEIIHNKKDHLQTMLWDYDIVKPTIDLMYAHRLWIFNLSGPQINGLAYDGWIEAGNPVTVMCPVGTHVVKFHLWRQPEWPSSSVKIHTNGTVGTVREIDTNKDFWISLLPTTAVLMIDGSDEKLSRPVTSTTDPRKLIAILSNVQCH